MHIKVVIKIYNFGHVVINNQIISFMLVYQDYKFIYVHTMKIIKKFSGLNVPSKLCDYTEEKDYASQ